ncbi:MAG: hypothetical protein JXB05_27070 [Myxococcaceae bacterium]|nr:hypothetical protein [Myxococcaceae bacterium]
MGHLFVPAALALWVVVAVVRMLSAPAPVQPSAPAVEVEVAQPRAGQPAAHGEG